MIGDQEYESKPEGAPKSVTVEPGATIYWDALAMTLNGSIAETEIKMESSTAQPLAEAVRYTFWEKDG